MRVTVAIDPGASGAVAALDASGAILLLEALPTIRDGRLAWTDGGALRRLIEGALNGWPARAVVERVSAMPGQGVASSFNFGAALGSVLATLQAISLPIELVTPAKWKRELGLGSDKRQSLDRARLLWPGAHLNLAKHEGLAEALLLAHWRQQQDRRPEPSLSFPHLPKDPTP